MNRVAMLSKVLALTILTFSGIVSDAYATITLPRDETERRKVIGWLNQIASDYNVTAELVSGTEDSWIAVWPQPVFPAPTEREPKGDDLVRRAISSQATINISIVPGRVLPETSPSPNNREESVKRSIPRSRGGGTNSDIPMGDSLNDGSFTAEGTDAAGNNTTTLPLPLFIMLAHELIHAVHNENGTREFRDAEKQAITTDTRGHGITENDIRGEHTGMGTRIGHVGHDTGN